MDVQGAGYQIIAYSNNYMVHQIPSFFGKCLKKTTEYFLKFIFFYLKVQTFRLIMENNFIQMAASAGHFPPLFKRIHNHIRSAEG